MKKYLAILAALLMVTLQAKAAESATSILQQAAAKVTKAKSLVADYTISADGHSQNGILTISGERFTLSSPQMVSWYDGKTQWTYSSHIGEVNITEPTPEELQQVNPFAIIRTFSKNYKATLEKSAAGTKQLRLTAISAKSDIKTVVLTLDATTLYPTKIQLVMANRQQVNIKINKLTEGPTLPMSHFRFDPKKYPDVPVVDLR